MKTVIEIEHSGMFSSELMVNTLRTNPLIDNARIITPAAPIANTPAVPDDLAALVKQLVQALRKAAPDHDLPTRALDYLKRNNLQGSPLRQTNDGGIERAAKLIEKRRDDYIEAHGSYDPDTGATEFPGNGDEYVGELDEIVEGIRALATPSGEVK